MKGKEQISPSPWEAYQGEDTNYWWVIRDADGYELGSTDGGFEESDAKLMARAPEMQQQIDALKAYIAKLNGFLLEMRLAIPSEVSIDGWIFSANKLLDKTPEQSLEQHDREIYNKAIDEASDVEFEATLKYSYLDAKEYVEGFSDGIKAIRQAIRQLYKQPHVSNGTEQEK